MNADGSSLLGVRIDRCVAVGLVLNLAWTTWHLGGYLAGPLTVSFPLQFSLLAVVVLRGTVLAPTGLPRGWWWPLPFLGFAAWHVAVWSATPGRAWLDALQWTWMAAGFWCGLHLTREPGARRILVTGVGIVTVGLAGLAVYQRIGDTLWLPMERRQVAQYAHRSGGTFGVPNTLAAWMVLVLPCALAAWRWPEAGAARRWRRAGAATLAVAAAVALALTVSRGGWLALAVALAAWPVLAGRGAWGVRLARSAAVGAALLALAGAAYAVSPEVRARAAALVQDAGERTRPQMWRAAWGLFRDEPLLGTGAGSFPVLLERHRPMGFRDAPRWAHNDYLNTLSDYGAIGFALSFGAAAAVVVGVWIRRRRRPAAGRGEASGAAGAGIGLLALALALLVDFHLKLPALALLAALVAADWVHRTHPVVATAPVRPGIGRWGPAVVGVTLSLVVGWVAAPPRHRAEALRFYARESIDLLASGATPDQFRAVVEQSLRELEEAVARAPGFEPAWSDLAWARALQAHWRPEQALQIGREAEGEARRALALAPEGWEAWIRLGVALDLQDRWGEAGEAFGRAVKLAPHNAVAWYYQAFHFHLKPSGRLLARVALSTCLRLDPGNRDAEALRAAMERSR